jgi:hypothetical protein
MTTLLAELGKKLTERWLSALLLPGLLFVGASVCARLLGHRHALDPQRLATQVDRLGHSLHGKPAAIALTVAAALLAATGAGLASQALAGAVHTAWTTHHPRRWVDRRRARTRIAAKQRPQPLPDRYLPARATLIGDQFYLIGERVDAQYGLAVTLAWPRLWLLLEDRTRSALQTAYSQYHAATAVCAWGLLYLTLGGIWWPAILAGLAAITVGYRRGRATAGVLADLIEAAVDTHQCALAKAVGIALPHGRITPEEGLQINDILNKRA